MGGLGRAFVRGTVFVAALFGFSTAAFAQADPGINPVVVATPDTVTLSRSGLVTYAGYVLTFKNTTTNSLNRIYFNADAFNTNSTEVVKFDSSNLPACTGFDTASLRCQTTISLAPGELRESFSWLSRLRHREQVFASSGRLAGQKEKGKASAAVECRAPLLRHSSIPAPA